MSRRDRALQSDAADPQVAAGDLKPAEFTTQAEICRRLGISDETWRTWRKRGLTPPQVPLPGRPRWRTADINAWLDDRSGRRRYFGARRSA